MIDFIKTNRWALAALAICLAALFAVNAWTLEHTRGAYNAFEILFL